MFDILEEELFAEAVWEIFGFLDQRYVADMCKELIPRLNATFDQVFETTFVILDRETGRPMNVNAVLTRRDSVEQFLRILGDDKYEIGILLRDR
jgi:hypothetical protein